MRFLSAKAISGLNVVDDMVPYVALTVGGEVANVVRVEVQLKDAGDDDLAARGVVNLWCGSSEWGAIDTPGTWAIVSGRRMKAQTSNAHWLVLTDATGLIEVDITNVSDYAGYMHAEIGGLAVSGAIAFSSS